MSVKNRQLINALVIVCLLLVLALIPGALKKTSTDRVAEEVVIATGHVPEEGAMEGAEDVSVPAKSSATREEEKATQSDVLSMIPEWDGSTPYVFLCVDHAEKPETWNDKDFGENYDDDMEYDICRGIPFFTADEIAKAEPSYSYSDLDTLGRTGEASACLYHVPQHIEREEIGHIKPSGWNQEKYECIKTESNPGYLYNRCHLIASCLGASNEQTNLITGTRYLNVIGMLPFENMVAETVKSTDLHVLYRVTPVYQSDNLVASGVLLEGYSQEDDGEAVSFCVYVYNEQPGIKIDHRTGKSDPVS